MYSIEADKLSKRFGSRKVFSDISFSLSIGDSLAIIGANGSGKTTLIMTMLGGLRPSKGEIRYSLDGSPMEEEMIRQKSALVAPYLNLYDNLTGEENLQFFSTVSGGTITGKEIDSLLTKVGLEGRGVDMVGAYSSGMKQRLKYAVAILGKPAFLFLDEPTSNLDENGKQIVVDFIEQFRSESIIVIATNEQEEYKLASQQCRID